MQKKAYSFTGGYGHEAFGQSKGGSPMDPESAGLAIPIAAIMLASYGGYKAANKVNDDKATAERRARIKKNLNRLGKANLDLMQTVRKQAGLIGTMVNPFQGVKGMGGEAYVPEWFKPSGGNKTSSADALMFKTLALAGTYGSGAYGLKYLLGSMERQRELQEGNVKIQEAVKASMPIISPDPTLTDAAAEERERMTGMKKNVLLKESEERGSIGQTIHEWSTGYKDPKKGTYGGTAMAAAALLALGAFGAGAVLTKNWADDRDPNRQRVKAAEKAAQRMALMTKPPAIVGAIDPKIKEQLDAHITGGRIKVRPNVIDVPAGGAIEDQETDPTDELSKNIAAV